MTQARQTSSKNQSRHRAALLIAVCAFIVLAAFVMWLPYRQAGSGQLTVVAAENPWGKIAAQIAGTKAHVTSIITNPNADPHLYESDAHDAMEVATAGIIISNGLGYDDFIDKLMSTGTARHEITVNASSVMGLTGPDDNPHLWYNIPQVPEVAAAIEQALATRLPADRAYFQANLTTFDNSLTPIMDTINQIKTQAAHVPVAYTERVPGYLIQTAGLDNVTPVGFAASVEDGTEPSPQDTAAMQRLIQNHQIKVLLYNTQTISSVTTQIREQALRAHIPVVGVSETAPPNMSYAAWQESQASSLLKALTSS